MLRALPTMRMASAASSRSAMRTMTASGSSRSPSFAASPFRHAALSGTRSFQRRAMSSEAGAAAESGGGILGWGKRNPFAFQVIIATAKTSASDLLVQKTIEGRDWSEIDLKRNLVFVAFGAVYLGWAQYQIYVHGFRAIFGSRMDKFANLTFAQKLRDGAG